MTGPVTRPTSVTTAALGVRVVGLALVCAAASYGFSRLTGRIHDAIDIPVGLPALLAASAVTARAPRRFGWQWGSTARHWPLLVACAISIALVVAAFRIGSGQVPYAPSFAEVVLVPLGEEGLFRGFLLVSVLTLLERWLPRRRGAPIAVGISAIAFGVGHLGNLGYVPTSFVAVQAVAATAFGLVAGWVRLRTDSLAGPVLLHGVMNAAAVV